MKKLIIIRHAQAEDHAPADYARRLTSRGAVRLEATAAKLAESLRTDDSPLHIIASPAARTAQSAEIVARAMNYLPEEIDFQEALYRGNYSVYLDAAARTDDEVGKLMVVGHNPAVTELAGELLQGEIAVMRKGSVAIFEFEMDRWQDIFVTTARLVQFII